MDPYLDLARKTIETYVKERKVVSPTKDLPKEMFKKKAGAFVSIHRKGELRGCMGTIMATQNNIALEIIHNAISSAAGDPRFTPITKEELADLEISVDILSEMEVVAGPKDLDPIKYGVFVKAPDGRSGLLLPDLKDVKTIDQQILIACHKAGIDPEKDKFLIYRFTVERYKES